MTGRGRAAPLLGVLDRLAVGTRDHDEKTFHAKSVRQLQGLASGILLGREPSRHSIHVDGSDNELHPRSPIERKPRSVALRRNGFPPIGLPARGDEFASQYPNWQKRGLALIAAVDYGIPASHECDGP
jgi:hypothetical protein